MEISIVSEEELAEYIENKNFPGFWNAMDSNCSQWAQEANLHPFWEAVRKKLEQWRSEYCELTDHALLTHTSLPLFEAKPITSIKDKLFRQYQEYVGKEGTHEASRWHRKYS